MLVYTFLSRIVFYIIEKGQAFETSKISGRGIARPFWEQRHVSRVRDTQGQKNQEMSLTVKQKESRRSVGPL